MTTYLGKSCSFGLPRVPFVNCRRFMYLVISRMWDLIVSVPDHCLSFYFRICYYTIQVSDIVLEKKIRNQNIRLGNLGSAARLGSGFYTPLY